MGSVQMIRVVALAGLMLTTAQPAMGDDHDPWALCPARAESSLPQGPDAHLPPGEAPLHITADHFDGTLEDVTRITGNVLLQQGPRSLRTDLLLYERVAGSLRTGARVEYRDGTIGITSERALLELEPDRLRFEAVDFQLLERRGRGSARSLSAERDRPIHLEDVRFTTCPAGDDSWQLIAPEIDLDTDAGVGTGRNVRIEFKGIPILYTPWISFPLNDERKTGFLAPDIGSSRRTGIELRVPWYWNIAPNQDATITPRLIGSRGLQLTTEYRYLFPGSIGHVDLDVMPEDRDRDEMRGSVSWRHRADLAAGWEFRVDFNHVTDPDYFADFGDSLSATTVTHQRRMAELSYHGDRHSMTGRVDGYQTLDREIPRASRPYARLPQLFWRSIAPGPGGLEGVLAGELVRFDSDGRVTGERLDLQPSAGLRLGNAGWFLEPRAAYRHTRYQLDGTAPGTDTEPTRSLPVLSLDAGLMFERDAGNGVQTLEPRAYYLFIPYRDQDSLPLFDTSTPDFNTVQLFRENRFNGADRVGDANQLALGIGTRRYDAAGIERYAIQVGRIAYFDDRRVVLPGEAPGTESWSDVITEARARLGTDWAARLGVQWDPGDNRVERSTARVRWRPGARQMIGLSWHFRRNRVDQADLGFSWPLGERWGIIGRWNYSFEDRKNLETVFGVEYQSCCWAARLISREYIATREGDTNRSLYLQLQLKGLASFGRGTAELVGRDILNP